MELPPPALTRSPASPPDTCLSERSSSGYPSPVSVNQEYNFLFPPNNTDLASVMAHSLDSGAFLPPSDAGTEPEWSISGLGTSPTSVNSAPMSLAYGYDPFANYHAPLDRSQCATLYAPPATAPAQDTLHAPQPLPYSPSRLPELESSSRSPSMCSPANENAIFGSRGARLEPRGHGDFGQAEGYHYVTSRYEPSSCASPGSNHSTATASFPEFAQSHVWYGSELNSGRLAGGPPSQRAVSDSGLGRVDQAKAPRPQRATRKLTTKDEANFECDVKGCGKLFSRSYNFKAHMDTHDENREYPYPCQDGECDKKFVRKTDLLRHHQSVHAKVRNFKCNYCSRLFARKDTLRRHMDDGCSRRFDLSTLNLPAVDYDGAAGGRELAFRELGYQGSSRRETVPPLTRPAAASGESNQAAHQLSPAGGGGIGGRCISEL